jgi:hypothetical protein
VSGALVVTTPRRRPFRAGLAGPGANRQLVISQMSAPLVRVAAR